MEIVFEYDDIKQSDTLEALVRQKLDKLAHKYQMIVRADVFIKEENTKSPDTGKICNIRLSLPGPRLFAESSHNNFESSVLESVQELERQLKKTKR